MTPLGRGSVCDAFVCCSMHFPILTGLHGMERNTVNVNVGKIIVERLVARREGLHALFPVQRSRALSAVRDGLHAATQHPEREYNNKSMLSRLQAPESGLRYGTAHAARHATAPGRFCRRAGSRQQDEKEYEAAHPASHRHTRGSCGTSGLRVQRRFRALRPKP